MLIKLSQIVTPFFASGFVKILKEISLTASQCRDVIKSRKIIEAEAKDFEEARVAAAQKYGKKETNGVEIPANRVKEFLAELDSVLKKEIELPMEKITVPTDRAIFTAAELEALADLTDIII